MKTWIVIADASHVRAIATKGIGQALERVPDFAMSQIIPRSSDLGDERPARTHESSGKARHAIEPKTDAHRELKRDFAAQIASKLETAAAANAFDRLVIAAPPAMLGDLRHFLSATVRNRIAAELPKDLVKVADTNLRSHLDHVILV